VALTDEIVELLLPLLVEDNTMLFGSWHRST
jgi:hypothetical protein